jgi:AcrR family transcriptional regulator
MSDSADLQTAGLRERKKAKTRAVIQESAFRLFRKQGYDATTVQQISAEAEVSEGTFFRYFPTKAQVVLWDDFDPLLVETLLNQPSQLSAIQALRASFKTVFGRLSTKQLAEQRDRLQLVITVPELRATMLDQLASAMNLLAVAIAERMGQRPEDVAVRTLAGAVVGVAVAVAYAINDDPKANLATLLDEAMAHLEAGFGW